MPTNIGDAPLDGIKIGQAAIPKAYVGIDQIFPNTTEITAAAFDNANVTNTAQNTDYTVAGEIGSSFTLTGSSGATAPVGTQVFEEDNKTLIFDFKEENEKFVAAIGGKGGFGNTRFKSSTNRAPKKFTKGTIGEEFLIYLQH